MNQREGVCGIAFKEWSAVCAALATGWQSIILRKGGISEENGEFKPEHSHFWLFPTWQHQHEQGVKAEPGLGGDQPPDGILRIQHLATVERVYRVTDLAALHVLEPFHIWTRETVQKRFHYREPGLYVLIVGISALPEPVKRINHPEYDGCKTWVHLKEPIETAGLRPVLSEAVMRERIKELIPK